MYYASMVFVVMFFAWETLIKIIILAHSMGNSLLSCTVVTTTVVFVDCYIPSLYIVYIAVHKLQFTQ